MQIVEVIDVWSDGEFEKTGNWLSSWKHVEEAIAKIHHWKPGKFVIKPEKKWNGVSPIKQAAMAHLAESGWIMEGKWPTELKEGFTGSRVIKPGDIDAVREFEVGLVALEWETGNISSSHRSLNKLCMWLEDGVLRAWILIVPSKALYPYLTDRVGNVQELRPYIPHWRKSCEGTKWILRIVVVEHDETDMSVANITKWTDGRALR